MNGLSMYGGNLAGFSKTHLLNLIIQNELKINSDGDLAEYIITEENENFIIKRRTPSADTTIFTLDPSGNLTITGSLSASSLVANGIQDVDNTTSITTGSETLTFTTNSNERMRITSGGLVGIGTNNPSQKLDVVGDIFIRNSPISRLFFVDGADYLESDGTDMRLVVNSAEIIRFKNGGNVGIGSNNPTEKLDIIGNISIYDETEALIKVKDNTDTRIKFGYNENNTLESNSTTAEILADSSGNILYSTRTNFDSGHIFYTRSGTTPTERMRIDVDGNVGIGTNNPNLYKLHIEGTINDTGIFFKNSNNSIGALVGLDSGGDLILSQGNSADETRIVHNSSDRLVINNSHTYFLNSNVGFGLTTPNTARVVIGNNDFNDTDGILYFNHDSPWGFFQGGNGTSASLDLKTLSDNKKFRILNANNSVVCETTASISGSSFDFRGSIYINKDNTAFTVDENGGRLGFLKKFGGGPVIASATGNDIIFSNSNQSNILNNILSSTLTELMRIKSGGSVGIGTNDPKNILHLKEGNNIQQVFNLNVDLGGGISPTYYELATIDSGSGGVQIKGIITGHEATQGRIIVDLLFCLRTTFEVIGNVNGRIGTQDIVVYNNAGTYTIYLKAEDYCITNLNIKTTRGTILWDGTGSTTTPSGSLVYQASSTNNSKIVSSNSTYLMTTNTSTFTAALTLGVASNSTTQNYYVGFHRGSTIMNINNYEGAIWLDNSGNLAFQQASDIRLKENIFDYDNPYNKFKKINVKRFNYKDSLKKKQIGEIIGFVAQDLKKANLKCVGDFYTKTKKIKVKEKRKRIIEDVEVEEEVEVEKEVGDEDYKYLGISQSSLIPFLWAGVRQLIEDKEKIQNDYLNLIDKIKNATSFKELQDSL